MTTCDVFTGKGSVFDALFFVLKDTMTNQEIENKIFELIDPVVTEEECDLLEVEFVVESGNNILRVYIDKPEGVNVDDCSRVSGAIEDLIEVEDLMPAKYNLEVSSPGLNRPLKKKKHFEQVIGQLIQVKTFEKIENRKNYKGILEGLDDKELNILIDNQRFAVPFEQIRKANLVYVPK